MRAGRQQTKVVKGGREALCFDPDSMSEMSDVELVELTRQQTVDDIRSSR